MVNVNVLYNTTTGRILAAGLNSPSPVPAGHAVIVRDVTPFQSLFNKRVDPASSNLVDKDYLKVDSATSVPRSTVQVVTFSKHDGETNVLKGTPSDNEAVTISARQANQSFVEAGRAAFFNILQTALSSGAGQFRVATGVAPGQETIVVFNDTLRPVFQVFTYLP